MLIEAIAKDTRLSQPYLLRLAATASHRYKLYMVPKKAGGERLIAHPSRALKSVQRWLAENLFSTIPIHASAYAYREGISIRDNALIHLQGNFLLKLDFKEFFPSLKAGDVGDLLRRNTQYLEQELTQEDIDFVERIVSRRSSLPIGAPSSPVISNQLMFEFDTTVANLCAESGVAFTRYADDMFFSSGTPNILSGIHSAVTKFIAEMEKPKLCLNTGKTVYTSRRRKRVVTGIVLTSDRKISLGRAKKREIRSLLQRYRDSKLEPESVEYLAGFLAYANSVEPSFLVSMELKYGAGLIQRAAKK